MKTSRAFLAVAFLFLGASVAHAGGKDWVGPATYESNGVTITTSSIKYDGKKLMFKFIFLNKSPKEVVVDRNQLTVKTPDGQVHARYVGAFGGMTPAVHQIPAGTSHEVNADFEIGKNQTTATLVLRGVTSEGKDLGLPDFIAVPK